MKHNKFTTRTELKSLRMSIECAKMECGSLRMFKVCLVYSSMRLGVPFIAPRQLGAVESNPGRQFLPSVAWRTGQSGVPPDRHCSVSGADCFPKLAQPTVEDLEPLAHRTLSGAHRTVRCSHQTVGSAMRHARIVRSTVGAADRWLTGQSSAPPDSPVNFSRTPPMNS
jgi:malate/lactate dehydrogenase